MFYSAGIENGQSLRDPESRKEEILSELQMILDSAVFRSSQRAREFLSYVVHEALQGDAEALKERSIGVNLYHRPLTYVTGDDPVVRVKAAEVRRRLTKYYAETKTWAVKIEIPVGSYVPQFLGQSTQQDNFATISPAEAETPTGGERGSDGHVPISRGRILSLICVSVVVVMAAAFLLLRPVTLIRQFWHPLLSGHKIVLVCVPSPVSYALSSNVLKNSGQPDLANTYSELEMNTTPITLDPDATVKGKEITPLVDYYVNKDDASVVWELAKNFAKLGNDAALRIGRDLTFADLRSSPAVLIGAYNNFWTLKMSSDLPYVFKENEGLPFIQERRNAARTWRPEAQGRLGRQDFAIVARLLNSKTGQPLVIVAGTGMVGTEAAGRMLCNEDMLRGALAGAPIGWQKKNLEMVLETDQVEASASTARVVAMSAW